MTTRRRRQRRRAAVRQAARRRPGARRRADAGAALRHPAAGPPRRRGGQGRAPRARRVGARVVAGDDRSRRPGGRRHLPAQQPRQAQPRASTSRPPEGRELFLALVAAASTSSPRTSRPARWTAWASATTSIAARHPRVIYVVDLRVRQHRRLAVPRLAGLRLDGRGHVGHLRLEDRTRPAAGHDPGRRARRHQLRAVRGHRDPRRAAPPRPHRRGPVRRHRHARRDGRDDRRRHQLLVASACGPSRTRARR